MVHRISYRHRSIRLHSGGSDLRSCPPARTRGRVTPHSARSVALATVRARGCKRAVWNGAVLALTACAMACDCDRPRVGAIDVVPPLVYVRAETGASTVFQLEARLWTGMHEDRKGIPKLPGEHVRWKSNKKWLKVRRSEGHTVTLELLPGHGTPRDEAIVKAMVGGRVSYPSARIVVVSGDALGAADSVRAKLPLAVIPSVTFVAGLRASESGCPDSLYAFVRTTPIGQLNDKCGKAETDAGNAAVLATPYRGAIWSDDWNHDVNASGLQGAPRSLPIAVWVAINAPDLGLSNPELAAYRATVARFAREQIRDANVTFAVSRAGITLDTVQPITLVTSDAEIAKIGDDCWEADGIGTASKRDGVINVYIIDEMLNGVRGRECVWHEHRDHPVIYLSWAGQNPGMLVHEVSHALSLTVPDQGHTWEYSAAVVPGFDQINVMASGLDDRDHRGRDRLTAGQAFRMNADSASWLNVAKTKDGARLVREAAEPRVACQCPVAGRSPCPPGVDDAATPNPTSVLFNPLMCSDAVFLRNVSEVPALGIVAGRRLRAAPGTCFRDLATTGTLYLGGTAFFFTQENFTRPGTSCASWFAAFFQHHAPLYVPLPEPPTTWKDSRDEAIVEDAATNPLVVRLRIWYLSGTSEPAIRKLIHGDSAKAVTAFGETNLGGVDLQLVLRPVPSLAPVTGRCTPNRSVPNELNAYYVHESNSLHNKIGSRDGLWCSDDGTTDVILISTKAATHDSTALGHYLGRALGLSVTTPADALDNSNLMWSIPNEKRSRLTPGQVFRLHYEKTSWLNRSPQSPRQAGTLVDTELVAPLVLDCSGTPRLCPRIAEPTPVGPE